MTCQLPWCCLQVVLTFHYEDILFERKKLSAKTSFLKGQFSCKDVLILNTCRFAASISVDARSMVVVGTFWLWWLEFCKDTFFHINNESEKDILNGMTCGLWGHFGRKEMSVRTCCLKWHDVKKDMWLMRTCLKLHNVNLATWGNCDWLNEH